MKRRFCMMTALLMAFVMLFTSVGFIEPKQVKAEGEEMVEKLESPQAGYYFPKDILDWSLEKYPDQKNNISKTKLVERFDLEGTGIKSADNEAKVMAITIANASTSGTSPQGGENVKDGYAFTNWQYVDSMVYWGGSAGEGIIVTPAADFVDSAHKNGVPVVGTIFFPPEAYGGRVTWALEFLQKDENGNFPVADKLIEIADTLGFDGWFINEETSGNEKMSALFEEFLDYYNAKTDKKMVWYDSLVEAGYVHWQGALNEKNDSFFQKGDNRRSDEMFIDFRWVYQPVEASITYAESLNRDPHDLYFGYDTQGYNFMNTLNRSMEPLMQDGKLGVSVGLYCPDAAMRENASRSGEDFWNRVWLYEQYLWVNDSGQVGATPDEGFPWQGLSTYINEKTPLTSFPFNTSFNQGSGENLYKNGELLKEGTYYNRSTQDIMPTYKWDVQNEEGNSLKASLDVLTVYNGYTSLKLVGTTSAGKKTVNMLYGANAILEGANEAEIIKQGEEQINLVLEFAEGSKSIVEGVETKGTWDKVVYDLSELQGKTVRKIGIEVQATKDGETKINIGNLRIGNIDNQNIEVTDFKVVKMSSNAGVENNISLEYTLNTDEMNGANLYYLNKDGNRVFLKTVKNNNIFVEKLRRLADDIDLITLELVPLDEFGNEIESAAKKLDVNYGKLAVPVADFISDKVLIKVGEEVTFTQKDSIATSQFLWEIPGANIERGEGETFTVSFDKAGVYNVRHIARNLSGEDVILKENLIIVYDQLDNEIENIALNKPVIASAYVNSMESPKQAVDGITSTKWCDNSTEVPWMEIDLGENYTITSFEILHAEAGGEGSNMNTRDYYIESKTADGEYEKIVDVVDNTKGITEHALLKEAQKIKLTLPRAEQNGSVARIYEFRVYGFKGSLDEVVEHQEEISRLRQVYFDTRLNEEDIKTLLKPLLSKYRDLSASAKSILESNIFNPETDSSLAEELMADYQYIHGIITGEIKGKKPHKDKKPKKEKKVKIK